MKIIKPFIVVRLFRLFSSNDWPTYFSKLTLLSAAQLSQVQLSSLKYISNLSSTAQLSQVEFNSLKYSSTLSSTTQLSQVQLNQLSQVELISLKYK